VPLAQANQSKQLLKNKIIKKIFFLLGEVWHLNLKKAAYK
jgi:hypothetical protein